MDMMALTRRRWVARILAFLLFLLSCRFLTTPQITVNVPTPAPPTVTPTLSGTPTADPAALVVPTPEGRDFNACGLIAEDEAVAVLGDLRYAPIHGTDFAQGGEVAYTCQYDTEDNGFYLTVEIAPEAYLADAAYEATLRAAGDAAALVPGLGDDAFWEADKDRMTVRVGNAFLTMGFFFDNPDALKQAGALATIAVDRLGSGGE